MKSIFVTGGSGFLGSFLISELRSLGYHVDAPSSRDCNLLSKQSLDQYANRSYEVIFHLAAWTQAGDFCLTHPGEQWLNNQLINTHVLNWWFESQKKAKLIFMGTSCSYDPNIGLKESDYMLGSPVESLYTYAMTKRMLYQGAVALGKQYDLKWLCLVPSTLYGPNYHLDGRQMHFIFDLIRKILRGKMYGEDVVLWGDGMQKREIIHVIDFVRTMLKIAFKVENDIYNLGFGEEISIRSFAEIICDEVGYDFNQINFDTTKYVGATSKCLNIEKIEKELPGYKQNLTEVSVGLKGTIEWFVANKAYEKQ
jgi:GDP-L-fucose synthase